VNTY
jgi:hypothetical protein